MGISMMRFGCVFLAFVCVFGICFWQSWFVSVFSTLFLVLFFDYPLCFLVFTLNHTTRRLSGVEKGYTKMDRKVFLYCIMFMRLVRKASFSILRNSATRQSSLFPTRILLLRLFTDFAFTRH
jgi:hypothetical protein